MSKEIITVEKARELINRDGLKPILWHYSYNLEYFYKQLVYEDGCVYAETPINQWSPIPMFANRETDLPKTIERENPFWVCKLTTFEDYLKRRDKISHHPSSNFPTTSTFKNKHTKLKGKLTVRPLDDKLFIELYDRMRKPDHMGGEELLDYVREMNVGLPDDWLKMITLETDGIKAVGLVVDDEISNHLYNIASEIDKNGWGLYMIVLWIKNCCERGIKFVDAGISGTYGHYKNVIYLDTVYDKDRENRK